MDELEPDLIFDCRPLVPILEYDTILSWWKAAGELPPGITDLPPATFVCEINRIKAVCVSLIPWEGSPIAGLEFFIGNPNLAGELRQEATRTLLEHCEMEARARGKRRLFCMAPNDALNYYYERLGFRTTCRSISTLIKEL